jgi:hypothetical protein
MTSSDPRGLKSESLTYPDVRSSQASAAAEVQRLMTELAALQQQQQQNHASTAAPQTQNQASDPEVTDLEARLRTKTRANKNLEKENRRLVIKVKELQEANRHLKSKSDGILAEYDIISAEAGTLEEEKQGLLVRAEEAEAANRQLIEQKGALLMKIKDAQGKNATAMAALQIVHNWQIAAIGTAHDEKVHTLVHPLVGGPGITWSSPLPFPLHVQAKELEWQVDELTRALAKARRGCRTLSENNKSLIIAHERAMNHLESDMHERQAAAVNELLQQHAAQLGTLTADHRRAIETASQVRRPISYHAGPRGRRASPSPPFSCYADQSHVQVRAHLSLPPSLAVRRRCRKRRRTPRASIPGCPSSHRRSRISAARPSTCRLRMIGSRSASRSGRA